MEKLIFWQCETAFRKSVLAVIKGGSSEISPKKSLANVSNNDATAPSSAKSTPTPNFETTSMLPAKRPVEDHDDLEELDMLLGNHRVVPQNAIEPTNNKRFKTDEVKDSVIAPA